MHWIESALNKNTCAKGVSNCTAAAPPPPPSGRQPLVRVLKHNFI